MAAAGSPPVVIASATTVNPKRLEEFRVAGYLPKPFPLETFDGLILAGVRDVLVITAA